MGSIAVRIESSDIDYPLNFTINRGGVGGITGLTGANAPTVAIRDGTTLNSYLDFGDIPNFKTSGWTLKYASLSEAERGHYTRSFDISALSLAPNDVLIAEYHVDDGLDVVGDASDILIIVDGSSLDDIADAVWDEDLAGHTTPGTAGDTLANIATTLNAGRIKQGYTFDQTTNTLIVNISLEDATGQVDTGVSSATLELFDSTGASVAGSFAAATPDAQGVFRFSFSAPTLVIGENAFYSLCTIDDANPTPTTTVRGVTKITLVKTS